MTSRPALALGAALLAVGLTVGYLAAQPVQQLPPPPPQPLAVTGVGEYVVVTDLRTGQSWARRIQKPDITDKPETAWVALGSPVKR